MTKKNISLLVVLFASIASLVISIVLVVDVYKTNSTIPNSSVVDSVDTNNNANINNNSNNNVLTTLPSVENTTVNSDVNNNVQAENTTVDSQTENPTPDTPVVSGDPSGMSDAEILNMLATAVNKTKAYNDTLSVNHKETFNANVTECTGGSTVASIANSVVSSIAAPSDEVLTFNGGTATDSEGETVTILLPQKGEFRLTMDGVKSISATKNGDMTVVNITLVEETVDHKTFPAANAAGVGYLDLSTLDLGVLSIDNAEMKYPGSTIEAHIRPDGYIDYANYTISMDVRVATAGLLKANIAFEGQQTETWDFNW